MNLKNTAAILDAIRFDKAARYSNMASFALYSAAAVSLAVNRVDLGCLFFVSSAVPTGLTNYFSSLAADTFGCSYEPSKKSMAAASLNPNVPKMSGVY